ncbi:DUF1761 domain-containing protein [Sunxiuqinia elliptica]|uniref:Uncharacterized protein DUF1761 n=1 Tax=Sunxiuqinia elliptica TaxID=655355 RepID=A0A1I2F1D8_9BACT|nr:DUF1761 domain-containing protein [Sunxiuqinia elliptica]TDO05002.1 uncharacterized protein DUF1761 [Sunxiuqinia elliptica]TDO64550.1 uncharacterized protein DUF1761 [Sunxiuqinia elliptica]SFE98341.1 Protein of unknown function [Sunxiuqinia elliptica]
MDLSHVIANLNYWAILVAALSTFVVGSVWYSPVLFGKKWMALNGFTEEKLKQGLPMPVVFGGSFIGSLLAAFVLAMFLGSSASLELGIFSGFMIAVFWISTSRLNLVLFEQGKVGLFFIHAGYDVVTYVIMGAILGFWHG